MGLLNWMRGFFERRRQRQVDEAARALGAREEILRARGHYESTKAQVEEDAKAFGYPYHP